MRQFELFDDFVGIDLSGANLRTLIGGWTLIGVGTPAVTARPNEADAPGIIRLSTSAANNDTAILSYDEHQRGHGHRRLLRPSRGR